jgi:hypothetical protein
MSRLITAAVLCLLTESAVLSPPGALLAANTLGRDGEPVVLKGSDIPCIVHWPVWAILAYRYDEILDEMVQIPIQVDEMAEVDFGTIYGTDPTGFTVLTYTDTTTFTGPDPDTLFDYDDELVFMAKDAGPKSQVSCPITPGCPWYAVIRLEHPLTGDSAFVYIYAAYEPGHQSAGENRVSYTFDLLSGEYKTTYSTEAGPNPENSTVTTGAYSVHFSDRWIRDETGVTAGGAPGTDILDRHKNLFAPGDCARSEDTFSAGEGAFIINRDGAVRSIRGYIGANSGPTTYRIHTFYEEREEILTALRVHPISGIMDFFDYSPDASGMTYVCESDESGAAIDGSPDIVNTFPGFYRYEGVTGAQGTLAYRHFIESDFAPSTDETFYYLDDDSPSVTQCTGDDYAYGSSGLWHNAAIPNTDPYAGDYHIFEHTRCIRYLPPSQPLDFASDWFDELEHPLLFSASKESRVDAVLELLERAGLLMLEAWPNPAGRQLSVRFSPRVRGRIEITLYDVAGRHVMDLVDDIYGLGDFSVSRDVTKLAPGVYFMKAAGPGGGSVSKRIVITR